MGRGIVLAILAVSAATWKSSHCYPDFHEQIPNGNKVPSPCSEGETWQGIGHESNLGSGPLNDFGRDFLHYGLKWTAALCKMDSDGDGRTNGEELGDPNCVWASGATPAVTNVSLLSHPGVCEPIDSAKCSGKVNFLLNVDTCAGKLNASHWCPAVLAPDVQSIELRFDNDTVIPPIETSYFCQTLKVPATEDYHIIGWEPIIDKVEFSHHMLMFACDSPQDEANIIKTGNYSKPVECGLVPPECPYSIAGWAVGLKNRCYPDNTGLRMGKSTYRYVIVQIHYNNPSLKKGYLDTSGIRLYYTTKLRQYDVASSLPGQGDIAIPPGSSSTRIIGKSFQTVECSRKRLKGLAPKYNISALLVHMHKMGYYSKVTLEKVNGQKIILVDEPFFYNQQRLVTFDIQNQPVLEPGDNLITECFYNSTERKTWTFFGKNTADEMCVVGIDIHPRPSATNHLSIGMYGMNDMCMFEEKPQLLCQPAALQSIIANMKNDNTSLWSACGPNLPAKSDKCCNYLNDHQYIANFTCVYQGSYQLVRALAESNKTEEINVLHANILNCISAVQLPTMASAKQAIEAEAVKTNSVATVRAPLSLVMPLALTLCALICA